MPKGNTTRLRKVTAREHTGLKGKLLEVRKIGSKPIFIQVLASHTIGTALKNADVPSSRDIKIEGQLEGQTGWEAVTLKAKAMRYSKLAVTTKVSGAF